MNAKLNKRFELLVSLNLEGISSAEEDHALWRLLKENTLLKEEFIQVRNVHYLVKVLCDDAASETAFANRVSNALHPDRVSEKAFVRAVQNRLVSPVAKKTTIPMRHVLFKVAASIMIVFGCAALYYISFFHNKNLSPAIVATDAAYLDWTYEPERLKLKTNLTDYYDPQRTTPYLYCGADNQILKNIKQMNDIMTRSEKLWP